MKSIPYFPTTQSFRDSTAKAILVTATVFIALVTAAPVSMGMGYPQEMFAEHVTTRSRAWTTPPNQYGAQKATYSKAKRGIDHQTACWPGDNFSCLTFSPANAGSTSMEELPDFCQLLFKLTPPRTSSK